LQRRGDGELQLVKIIKSFIGIASGQICRDVLVIRTDKDAIPDSSIPLIKTKKVSEIIGAHARLGMDNFGRIGGIIVKTVKCQTDPGLYFYKNRGENKKVRRKKLV